MNSNPSKKEIDFVKDSLLEFNNNCVGNDNHSPLNLIEYDSNGNIIAGILGGTYWGWMYVDILWVHEDHRKKALEQSFFRKLKKKRFAEGVTMHILTL